MARKKETGFDKLAWLIKSESEDIRKQMATKDDTAGIMSELRDIKQRLKKVGEAIEDHSGHSKEIDHALERIAAIERHLGIKVKTRTA